MFLANNLNKGGGAAGGYQIQRSLRFNSADSAYLIRTPATATNRKTWTWSGWVKRSELGTRQQIFNARPGASEVIEFQTDSTIQMFDFTGSFIYQLVTTAVYRDPSAWYHIVWTKDTTQATDTNRMKLYVNGVQVTTFNTANYPTQNSESYINNNVNHHLGTTETSALFLGGYMTEVNFIDGQALTPSSFGETNAQTGVWQPKAYSGSYGTNGFYVNFSDNSNTTAATLGKDYSGNGNNWTPNNFSVTAGAGNDSLVDSPTSYGTDTGVGGTVRGNYATLNPLQLASSSGFTLSNGNLSIGGANANNATQTRATIAVSSGKWYWEYTRGASTAGGGPLVGVCLSSFDQNTYAPSNSSAWLYYCYNGNKFNGSGSAYGATWTSGDVVGIAFDLDAGTLTFYKNGTSQGTAFTNLAGANVTPFVSTDQSPSSMADDVNFGQRPFAYTAPSGYKALCTQNLPTPTIGATTATQAGKYFNPVLYTGNGGTQSVTGVGFQPDWVWIKERNSTGYHVEYDAVRGVEKYLFPNVSNAEGTGSGTGVTVFGSDGFTAVQGGSVEVNRNAITYVAWNWKANGSGSTNTAGSITSTVSANTTSGFSVVTFTTATSGTSTVGHGLGVAPKFVIFKVKSTSGNWICQHASIGTQYLLLNTTDAAATSSGIWNSAPTSTVVNLGSDLSGYGGATAIMYCFAEVAGYSKISSYTGNGSADGPFVYCGFRPAYVMLKNTTTSGTSSNWIVQDTTRDTYNAMPDVLFPNLSNAEASDTSSSGYVIDCLSNGFKIRNTNLNWNANNQTYIFMAFASSPFKYSLAR